MAQAQDINPISHVRRADRAVEDDGWIREFLRVAAVGVLATVSDGQPFLNSNLFVYDESAHAIYLHTAAHGRTRDNLQEETRVCFTATEMGRLLPAKEALAFSVEYASVVVFGVGQQITDRDACRHGLQLLLDKYAPHLRPGRDYRPITDDELKRTAVYRIDITEWSGKKKEAAPDFPGAYLFAQHSGKT